MKNQKPKTLNLPNILTLVRLALVPFVVLLMLDYIYKWSNNRLMIDTESFKIAYNLFFAGVIFIIASFTDFLDGYLARKNNQVTDFGKFFDPIADKLLVNATLILFASQIQFLPVWVTLVLILRDIFVDFVRMILSSKNITLAAGKFGKLKTVFQMIGLSLLFFLNQNTIPDLNKWFNQLILLPMYIAVAFSLYSGAIYFIKARKDLF